MAEINKAEVMDALQECYDPEIPVNIVDLGLIYNVAIDDEAGQVDITMTLTALGCPMAGEVVDEDLFIVVFGRIGVAPGIGLDVDGVGVFVGECEDLGCMSMCEAVDS